MKDRYGRELTDLRVSITSRCNLRCKYCHMEGYTGSHELNPEQIERIVSAASRLGMRRVKITGGEPMLREDIIEIVERIRPHVDELSMVTNGTKLRGNASKLRDAGVDRINISLPSLSENVYMDITGGKLKDVMNGIDDACGAGFSLVKLNMVVIRSNVDEIWKMIDFSLEKGAVLQLIELEAPREKMSCDFYRSNHVDLSPIEDSLKLNAVKIEERSMNLRRKYWLKSGAEVEVVKPMHNTAFCMHCHRLRVTSDGKLKPCLLRNDNLVDLLPLLNGDVRKAFEAAAELREPYWK